MKMETGMHAERDAVVKAVHVHGRRADRRQGQQTEFGRIRGSE
jgi:biotin carboxyl carrier protein